MEDCKMKWNEWKNLSRGLNPLNSDALSLSHFSFKSRQYHLIWEKEGEIYMKNILEWIEKGSKEVNLFYFRGEALSIKIHVDVMQSFYSYLNSLLLCSSPSHRILLVCRWWCLQCVGNVMRFFFKLFEASKNC